MNSIKSILGGFAIIGGLVALAGFIQAQVTTAPVQDGTASLTATNVDWSSASDLEVMLAAIEMTTPLPATDTPDCGNFYTVQHAGDWPPLPGNIWGLPFWDLGNGFYLLDDRTVDYDALAQARAQARTMAMDDSGPPAPGDGDDSGGTDGYSGSSYIIVDYGTNLWIAQVNISSNNLTGIASNTVADIQYEIQSLTDLTQTNWVSQGFILGSETTNWTPLNALAVSLTNNFFIRLRSWASSDGSGLPDWWELEYFGHTGVDPFGDPEGDGWDNLQKFENGMNPNVFYASPAPPDTNTPPPTLTLVSGPQGYFYVIGSGLPSDLSAIRIFRYSEQYTYGGVTYWPDGSGSGYPTDLPDGSFDIPVASITNGIAQIPASEAYSFGNYTFEAAAVRSNGVASSTNYLGYDVFNSVFVDGRAQLKDNVRFLLRAASEGIPFEVNAMIQPTNYVYSGFYDQYADFDPLTPFENNYFYRNFDFDVTNMIISNFGYIPNGGGDLVDMGMPEGVCFGPGWGVNLGIDANGIYTGAIANYTGNLTFAVDFASFITTNSIVAPSSWNVSQSKWLFPVLGSDFFGGFPAGQNLFGLSYLSELSPYYTNNTFLTETNYPDGPPANSPGGFYLETAQPGFETVDYYFARVGIDPMPEQGTYSALSSPTAFSTTNTTPLLIAGVGQSMPQLAGYAKLAVTNGYSGMYAYLGQYFTNAYEINTNGVVPTNSAGILSPYGNFFATEPGPAALVTMPDIDTGAQGTCTVYCVSLVLDKNHDTIMDGSFNGPDATSQASPMEWWINDDYDYSGASWNYGNDVQSSWYYNDGYQRKIDSQRDLEDYARLWICGMPALTNGNYQVTLSWANVSSGNPTINLFDTVETNGGIGYLTNLDTATAEAYNYGIWGENRNAIATISPGQPFTIPASYFTNAGDKHFLFDGAITNGAGELMLTIADGNGNTIAQTGAWLDLHHIDDFFEQAVITNNMSGAKSNWTSSVEIVQPAVSSALGDDQDLIVLVHGINVKPWDCVNDAETVCKRLYWAGYHGKFAEVEWPCNLLTPIPSPLSPAVFNDSELQGYKASQALTTYLTQLRARFPGYRLHLLVHSQGNAVVSEAIRSGVTFDTYILTQGALPASAYDVNAPVDSDIASYEGSRPTPEWQPMGYRGIYTNFTGRIVNFYNSQDGVLNYWVTDQKLLKPSVYFDTSYYFYNGTNSYFDPPFSANYLVTDPEESRADVSRSRTLPIGQSGPASGHGVIQSAVDLNANFGFNSDISEHSAQWTRPIQTSRPYFQQVLRSCQIIPAP